MYSFEPVPYLAEQIRVNIKLNNINNVTIIINAVSDSVGLKTFDLSENLFEGHIVDAQGSNSAHSIQVSCTSLDHFVFSEKKPPPQVMKIDVEGAESSVLDGSYDVIEKYRPIIVCELHNPNQDIIIGETFIKHRYGAYILCNGDGELVKELDRRWPLPAGLRCHFVAYPKEEKKYAVKR